MVGGPEAMEQEQPSQGAGGNCVGGGSKRAGQEAAVVTTIDTGIDATAVKISWTAPADNSDAITEYRLRGTSSGSGGQEARRQLTVQESQKAQAAAAPEGRR